jgi:hypothetical protein
MAEVSPSQQIDRLDQLTFIERKIMQYALQNGDSVNLPYAVSNLMKMKQHKGSTKHAVEVSASRAAQRLYTRGLATVQKCDDGLVWVTVSRPRILAAIRADIQNSEPPAAPDFNLMKVPCEIPTFPFSGDAGLPLEDSPETKPKRTRRDPMAMPRRCSGHRLRSCRLLTGVKTLARPDKVSINYDFELYTEEVNDKILTLLEVKTGEVIGSEYSTRFNDIGKAAASLNKFDYALEQSLQRHYKAVFLTLTTDPNLTDEERAANRARAIADVRGKLASSHLQPAHRASLTRTLYRLEGPDYEIAELEAQTASGTLCKADLKLLELRLSKLRADRDMAVNLRAQLEDPKTGIRTRERIVQSLKRLGRWEYKHDPNGFASLWEANRTFAPSWNKFLSYLTKINHGQRPEYLASFEYTESGLMHVHALLFVDFLLPNDDISREWKRVGQGEISYIYALKNVQVPGKDKSHREWRWNARSRPSDAKTMSGGDYLKKYVRKCMLALLDDFRSPSDIQSLYWAFNKRMYTCSQVLTPSPEDLKAMGTHEAEAPKATSYVFYRMVSESEAEVPDGLHSVECLHERLQHHHIDHLLILPARDAIDNRLDREARVVRIPELDADCREKALEREELVHGNVLMDAVERRYVLLAECF